MGHFKDLTGKSFGKLFVVGCAGRNKHGQSMWRCRCSCGKFSLVMVGNLKGGRTKSCKQCVNVTHGDSQSVEFKTWLSMIQRCQSTAAYKNRGISVCARWKKYENFLLDMGRKPSVRHSIDRIKNNLGYSPSNCRWALPRIQARNTRWNHRVRINKRRLCLAEWEEISGIPQAYISHRLARGWSPRKAVFTPVIRRLRQRELIKPLRPFGIGDPASVLTAGAGER